jgi:uncharacterized protein (TIGR02145 family)
MNGVKLSLLTAICIATAFTFLACEEKQKDGSLTYEGQTYKTVIIGSQTWMAENLNYVAPGSKCGGTDYSLKDENTENCNKYGRLYNWATAMALPANCNSSECSSHVKPKHKGVCPLGWHIPSNAEWEQLLRYADSSKDAYEGYDAYESYVAGKHLKAKKGWNDYEGLNNGKTTYSNGNGEDTYGFAALPGGFGFDGCFYEGRFFSYNGETGFWWSSSEKSSRDVHGRVMFHGLDYVFYRIFEGHEDCNDANDKNYLRSVRCVKD